jgi:hypothetical protein
VARNEELEKETEGLKKQLKNLGYSSPHRSTAPLPQRLPSPFKAARFNLSL